MSYQLFNADCLQAMRLLKDKSVDMILADLPYGTTQNKWDSIIPLEPMWAEFKRICKGAIVLTAAQPFTSVLVCSNLAGFKYDWVWKKSKATGHLNSKKRPLVKHETVLVFESNRYNPQGLIQKAVPTVNKGDRGKKSARGAGGDCYGISDKDSIQTHTGFPLSVIDFEVEHKPLHPTQKPVTLMEYLIRTYTNEGDTVLDNTMGSGTTGVACMNAGRNFIGMEKDTENGYFEIARKRIAEAELNTF